MTKKPFWLAIVFALALAAFFVSAAQASAPALSGGEQRYAADEPPGDPDERSERNNGGDNGSGSSGGETITQIIIHKLFFDSSLISDALKTVFLKAAEKETAAMSGEINRWASLFAEVLEPPGQGKYIRIARSSLPVAAALAPALFLLRLALHHWQNMTGQKEGVLEVVGDWITAGALALAAGPLLDLFVRLGYWAAGMVVGEAAALARQFVSTIRPDSLLLAVGKATLMGPLISIAMGLAAVLAVAGMVMAFAASTAALYILGLLAMPLAVIGVLPQMRWTRSLWFKAVLLISLVPLVAGGILKAGLTVAFFFQGGLLSYVTRVIWLWGAVGALLSLAGVLGKVTLGAATDTVAKTVGAVKTIAGMAALGVAAGGAGAAAGMAAGTTAGSAGASSASTVGGLAAAGMGIAGAGETAAINHLNAAQSLVQKSGTASAFGFNAAAQFYRAQAQSHQIAAQRALLEDRLSRLATFDAGQFLQGDFAPNTPSQMRIANGFGGDPGTPQFREAYEFLGNQMQQLHPNLNLDIVSSYHPEEIGWMMRAYLENKEIVEAAEDPIHQAALLARPQASGILRDLYGEQDA